MIFKNENGSLKEVKNINFSKERELQRFVENNMEIILGYKFIDTEFPIEDYRFDSVAFDEENNAFVIVEYKRGQNESLVDQGYAYLKTLISRKADFVLLYNEKNNTSKNKNDFDWSQTKMVFISPKFTPYQIDATAYGNMPFELYEVKKYENDLYDIDRINKNKKSKSEVINNFTTENMKQVNKEIKTYDESYYLGTASATTKELYLELKDRIMELDFNLTQCFTKLYTTFKSENKRNVVDLWLKKDWVEVVLALKKGELLDNENLAYDISNRLWSATQYAFRFDKNTDIDYAMNLIRQSCKKSR